MKPRLNHWSASPKTLEAAKNLEQYVRSCGLEHSLLELIKIRASQINQCAFCLDIHTREARAAGESEQRIYLLSAWRESPLFSARERAALEWTESVTLIAQTNVPDSAFETVRPHFTDEELVKLTMAINTINAWNRFAVAFRAVHPVPANRETSLRS